ELQVTTVEVVNHQAPHTDRMIEVSLPRDLHELCDEEVQFLVGELPILVACDDAELRHHSLPWTLSLLVCGTKLRSRQRATRFRSIPAGIDVRITTQETPTNASRRVLRIRSSSEILPSPARPAEVAPRCRRGVAMADLPRVQHYAPG